MNRLGLFAFVLILGCEHFEGELLAPGEWIEIPGLEGRWDVPHTTDEPISIVKSAQAKEYRIVPRQGDVPGVVRFASIDGRIIGEYRDGKEGKPIRQGYIFRMEKSGDCFLVSVGQEITEQMVDKYKLIARAEKSLKTSLPSYVLNGTAAQNRRALDALLKDPHFFPDRPGLKICRIAN